MLSLAFFSFLIIFRIVFFIPLKYVLWFNAPIYCIFALLFDAKEWILIRVCNFFFKLIYRFEFCKFFRTFHIFCFLGGDYFFLFFAFFWCFWFFWFFGGFRFSLVIEVVSFWVIWCFFCLWFGWELRLWVRRSLRHSNEEFRLSLSSSDSSKVFGNL